jgi:hypothetical protein
MSSKSNPSRKYSIYYRLHCLAFSVVAIEGYRYGKGGWEWFLVAAGIAAICGKELKMGAIGALIQYWRQPTRQSSETSRGSIPRTHSSRQPSLGTSNLRPSPSVLQPPSIQNAARSEQ